MFRKLSAGVGIAALLVISIPTVASATQQTVEDDPGGVIAVDKSDTASVDRPFEITAPGQVERVTADLHFASALGLRCGEDTAPGLGFSNELSLTLISPSGTETPLVVGYGAPVSPTYQYGATSEDQVHVVFDDAAANAVGTTNGGIPESGTFRPASPLAAFNGEDAMGTWQLRVADTAGAADQCYFGASLTVETDALLNSTTELSASSTTATVSDEVVLYAQVDEGATGDVDFQSDGMSLGVAPVVNGMAQLPVKFDAAGDHDIVAEYSGDTSYSGSESNTVTIRVTSTTLTDPPTTNDPVRPKLVDTAA